MLSADRDWFYFFSDMQAFSFFNHSCTRAPEHVDLVAPVAHETYFPDQGLNPCPLHWKVDS